MKETRHTFATLDGLRGVAALIVVLFHRRWWFETGTLAHGFLAVDFFFMLSGFVVAFAYEHRFVQRQLDLSTFIRIRAERLGPLLFLGAAIGATQHVADALTKHWLGQVVRVLAAFPIAAASFPVPWLRVPFEINKPAWSLFFEIFANLAFAMGAFRLSSRQLLYVIISFGATYGILVYHYSPAPIAFGFSWAQFGWGFFRVIPTFFCGVLICRLWENGRLVRVRIPAIALALLLAAALVVPALPPGLDGIYLTACYVILFPLLIVAGAQSSPPLWLAPLFKWGAFVSYPLYILHNPILDCLDMISWFAGLPTFGRLLIALAVCIMISVAASLWIEQPVQRWWKVRRVRRAQSSSIAMAGS